MFEPAYDSTGLGLKCPMNSPQAGAEMEIMEGVLYHLSFDFAIETWPLQT